MDFEHFRFIAKNAMTFTSADGSKVLVINNGGMFASVNQLAGGFDDNSQNFMVVFNTEEDVTIDFGMMNINFSVLAPFSKLTVNANQRDVRGFLIGRRYWYHLRQT